MSHFWPVIAVGELGYELIKKLSLIVESFANYEEGFFFPAVPSLTFFQFCAILYREYYMIAHGYEFYLRVFNSISHSFSALTREISS